MTLHGPVRPNKNRGDQFLVVIVSPFWYPAGYSTRIGLRLEDVARFMAGKIMIKSAVAIFLLSAGFSLSFGAESIEKIQEAIQSTEDKSKLAELYRQLGDHYVSQDRIDEGAAAYLRALTLSREKFSVEDRLKMAIYLSWADRLDEAIEELRLITNEDPKNLRARTHLARVLSWAGRLAESIEEADRVLKQSPDNTDALLVKADALQWQGLYGTAVPMYRSLLEKGENFDARKGLSYLLLAVGNRTGAEENSRLLKPSNPREQNELKKLTDAIDKVAEPKLDLRYNYYTDSDGNHLRRYNLLYGSWMRNLYWDFSYRHSDARDKTRDNRAEDASLNVYTNVTDTLAVGGGLGFNQLGDGGNTNFLTGHAKADVRIFKGTLGVNFSREVLSDTAQLIENRIRMTSGGLYLSQALTDRFSLYGGYNRKFFSDQNRAHDAQFVSQYAVYLVPRISVGYKFRFLDFRKQSGSGFFDPDNYVSNRFFSSLYLEREKFYIYSEFYLGHQSFKRNGFPASDFIYGGSGSLGFKPTQNIALEFNVEGGNFAAGSATGFNYLTLGPRLLFRF